MSDVKATDGKQSTLTVRAYDLDNLKSGACVKRTPGAGWAQERARQCGVARGGRRSAGRVAERRAAGGARDW